MKLLITQFSPACTSLYLRIGGCAYLYMTVTYKIIIYPLEANQNSSSDRSAVIFHFFSKKVNKSCIF
jgi:hypothetical protein